MGPWMPKWAPVLGLLVCALALYQAGAATPRALPLTEMQKGSVARGMGRGLLAKEVVADVVDADVQRCLWGGDAVGCSLNPVAALKIIIESSASPMKDYIVVSLACGAVSTEEACSHTKECKWHGDTCRYTKHLAPFDSCLGEQLSVFLDDDQDQLDRCTYRYTSEKPCESAQACRWVGNDTAGQCEFDMWKLMTGVPSERGIPRRAKEVMSIRRGIVHKALAEADIQASEEILGFAPPPFACPWKVHPLVCSVASIADTLWLREAYCARRFDVDNVCKHDRLCKKNHGTAGHCIPSDDLSVAVKWSQEEIYLGAASDGAAANLLRQALFCLEKDEVTCNDQVCGWAASTGRCSLRNDFVISQLSDQTVQRPGQDCRLAKEIFDTGCLQHESEYTCEGGGVCSWDHASDLCVPGAKAYMSILFQEDEALQERAEAAVSGCSAQASKGACLQ